MAKYVTLSFDDGVTQDFRFIEMIDKYGLKCTFNLNSELLGLPGELIIDGIRANHTKVKPDEVRELYKNHEVAVHTLTHPNLLLVSDEEITRQVGEDAKNLHALTGGREIVGMAYPGGPFYDERVIRIITETTPIRYARSTANTYDFKIPERFMEWHPTAFQHDDLIDLGKKFLAAETEEDMLFYVWGHSYDFDFRDTWGQFERFCDFIAGRDGVKYVTNGEIYRKYAAK